MSVIFVKFAFVKCSCMAVEEIPVFAFLYCSSLPYLFTVLKFAVFMYAVAVVWLSRIIVCYVWEVCISLM